MSEEIKSASNEDILEKLRQRNAMQAQSTNQRNETRQRYLAFRLGKEWFGLEVQQVREISRLDNVTRVPLTPVHVMGITNLRGNITAVIDVRGVLGIEQQALDANARIIVANTQGLEAGIVAEQVSEVVDIVRSQIEPPLLTLGHERGKYSNGVVQQTERMLVLLNLNSILVDLKVG
jgi:purine-binding chemotaxis protein CheW